MVNSDNEIMFFNSVITIKKPLLNDEIKFIQFFYEHTQVLPLNILINNDYIFIFVNNNDYFNAKRNFRKLRYKIKLPSKKYLIIRAESTLIRLIFTFFQDTYIHNILFEKKLECKVKKIRILFLFKEDRLIAVGNSGNYIKTINFIFNNYLFVKNHQKLERINPVELVCELKSLSIE